MNTDIQLLKRYYDKEDKTALDILFSKHYPSVYQAVLHLVHNSFDASDITQSTFLQVIRFGRNYKPTGAFRRGVANGSAAGGRPDKPG